LHILYINAYIFELFSHLSKHIKTVNSSAPTSSTCRLYRELLDYQLLWGVLLLWWWPHWTSET